MEYRLSYSDTDTDLLRTMGPPGRSYWLALAGLFILVLAGAGAWWAQIQTGVGLAGKNSPVGWAVYITTFVFWVGIAHSGTLISAILFLVRVRWRAAVYRSAEAVTVFGLMTAGLFPFIHLGRVWVSHWILPVPNFSGLWPNFRSPLAWDVLAITTYLTVSSTFFFVGMLPDLAVVRDRVRGWRKRVYGFLAQGWQGTDTQWKHYTAAYVFLAALATPLVISVHSIVSWDFAMSIIPGWHSTIFAPYFVAGAIHSGLAMVVLLLIPLRKAFRIEQYITMHHLESLAKFIIFTALVVGFAYVVELFIAWYSGEQFEQAVFLYRMTGDYAWAFWLLLTTNVVMPMLLWSRSIRTSIPWLVAICVSVEIGMWLERFVIIVTSLAHDFLPSAWGLYKPTVIDSTIVIGSFAWFFFLFLIFVKVLPAVSMWEVKEQLEAPVKGGSR
ncbi:MAG: NrfD/PsrC family molybdoenzyme membrane anchor subunit [Bacteroidota bacterium]